MNILLLSPFLPYPLDQGGKIRIYNIIKNFSASHGVTLVAIVDEEGASDPGPLKELCREVILVKRPARLWEDRFAFFTGTSPYNVIRYHSEEMRKILRELVRRETFDLVQIEFSMMWQYAGLFKDLPVVLDAHNIEHRNIQQIGRTKGSLLWRMMYHLEEKRLRRVEEQAFRDCRLCFAVSDPERDAIARCAGDTGKVITAVNGVDPERFAFRRKEKAEKKILFLGGMDYLPNLDAAQYFLAEIFPRIRTTHPDAEVLMVGRELSRLGELLQTEGVQIHESVPEVLPWFYAADVLAVPLRHGAGTRIKVLEAMAAGLPIVSTTKGCEGLGIENGKELAICDDAGEFAEAVSAILQRPERGYERASKARELVMDRYTWAESSRIMSQAFSAL